MFTFEYVFVASFVSYNFFLIVKMQCLLAKIPMLGKKFRIVLPSSTIVVFVCKVVP